MIIIKPYYEIETIDGLEMLRHLEKIGRVCYKSEGKITPDSAAKFIKGILKRGHESVIEHEKVSVRIICDRGVSHELVSHRLCSFSQESTRYCDYSGGVTFIVPPWIEIPESCLNRQLHASVDVSTHLVSKDAMRWTTSMFYVEQIYNTLRVNYRWSPQQARSVLPNSLKTEIVITANLREWRHIFKLRTTEAAHPQMREIMVPMLADFKMLIPIIFDDIKV